MIILSCETVLCTLFITSKAFHSGSKTSYRQHNMSQSLMGSEGIENCQAVVSYPAWQYPGCSGKGEVLFTDWNTQRRKHLCAVKALTYGFHWRAASSKMCSLAIFPSYVINTNAFLQKSMTRGKVCLLSEWFGKAEKNAVGEFLARIYSMKTRACNGSWEIFRKFENRLCYIVPVSNDVWTVFTSLQEGRGCVAEERGWNSHAPASGLCFVLVEGEAWGWGKDTACTPKK